MDVGQAIEELLLVDQHVHSLFDRDLDRSDFESAITEAAVPPPGTFDSMIGMAVRQHCAPVLDLPPYADPADYVTRRRELGFEETTRRLLSSAGISDFCVDGGYRPDELMSTASFSRLSGGIVHTIVRLESLAEEAMAKASSPEEFRSLLDLLLEDSRTHAVGYKTVAAYRCGLDLDPAKPAGHEVAVAATAWFDTGDRGRLTEPTIIRHLVWWALEQGLPLQVHTGFGDPDLQLRLADPALLQPLVAATAGTGGRIVLLHCYPFERSAGYLAHAYPHVYVDTGLAIPYLGANAGHFLRGVLDLTPFHRLLFSTDAFGLPELVFLGTRLWRTAMTDVLTSYDWPVDEAVRIARIVGTDNARALYALG